MSLKFAILIGLMLLVLVILICGIVLMAIGNDINKKYGNMLMVARVMAQTGVVVLLGAMFIFS